MGADSSWIIARVLTDDAARESLGVASDFSNLVVLTAQVGHEYAETKRLGEAHLLPLMASKGVRFVQVARSGKSTRRTKTDPGYVVLSDSRETRRLFTEGGGYRLGDEMLGNGTVPQYRANSRTCSQKFKGIPCDRWLEDEFGETPFVQVMGFNADEQGRADRDDSYTGKGRLSRSTRYPLIEWGCGRKELEAGLAAMFGEPWAKSCCTFCPFQGTKAGRDGVIERIGRHPEAAAEAMFMERASLALNPRQPLFAVQGGCEGFYGQARKDEAKAAFEALEARLADCEYALYHARRVVYKTAGGKGGKRDLRILATGSRRAMASELGAQAYERGLRIEEDDRGTLRVWVEHRDEEALPAREELLVVAPLTAVEKVGSGFEAMWTEAA